MAFQKNLQQASDWLVSAQNPDYGWGLTPTQASSLVNTAEAIFVLDMAGAKYAEHVQQGLDYFVTDWKKHLKERGPKLRFVAFPLFVAGHIGSLSRLGEDAQVMKDWILEQRNSDDGGWGAASGDESDIYSTFLAVQALQFFELPQNVSNQARLWILGHCGERGWGFDSPNASSRSATAYALVALNILGEKIDPKIRPAISLLIQTERWDDEEASYAGTLWKHCTHSNVLSALAIIEDDLFSSTIAEGIRHSNHLLSPSGGWMETLDGRDNRTVRAQYWAAYYSEKVISAFDPSKFIPRVDAERTETTLQAPDFQHFAVKSRYASVIPTSAFRLLVYSIFLVGTALALELNRPSQIQFSDFSRILGFILLAASFVLMSKRPLVFRMPYRTLVIIVAALGALNLLFGVTIEGTFDAIKDGLVELGEYLSDLSADNE